MQTMKIIISPKRNPFAKHSLKTKHVIRINPPSVFLTIPYCILFIKKSKTSFQLVNFKSINTLNIQPWTRGCMLFFHVYCSISLLFAKKTFALFAIFAVNRFLLKFFAWKSSVRSVCSVVNCFLTNNN